MDGWSVLWLFWLAMFGAIEAPALLNKAKGDTLSEHVYRWFAVRDKPRGWQLRRGCLAIFLLWVSVHWLSGGAI